MSLENYLPPKDANADERQVFWRRVAEALLNVGDRHRLTCPGPSRGPNAGMGCTRPVKWITLGRGGVCSWCGSHSRGTGGLLFIPADELLRGPAGWLEHVWQRYGGRYEVGLLLTFLRQRQAI